MAVTVVGNTVRLTPAGSTTANVANIVTRTNTFLITNANASTYVYAGVFSTYAAAAAMDHPAVGTDGGGVLVPPNQSMTVIGNFGLDLLAEQDTVYVSAVTNTGSTSVHFTPVAPGSA